MRQRNDSTHRLLERLQLGQLGANVHLKSTETNVVESRRARIHGFHALKRNSKFVFIGAGRDLRVCVGVDVGIHADGYRRHFSQAARNGIDPFQFRIAFDIETIDPLFQGELDFPRRLTHTGKDTTPRLSTRGHDPTQFTLAHNVESTAEVRERTQHGKIGIRLQRKTNQAVGQTHRAIQSLKVIR